MTDATSAPGTPVLGTAVRVLAFRASRDELLRLDGRHLAFGLIATWLVGMGRYWDHPTAHLAQRLGLGSLVYVVVLSAFLWLVVKPLGPEAWSYRRLLTFVSLVSPPAVLYAIPVERLATLDTARSINVWFLGVVATWRVGLLAFYLARLARLSWFRVVLGTLLPLTFLITALAALNLERAVFDIMGGNAPGQGTANDTAYEVLFMLTLLSLLAFFPLAIVYAVLVAVTDKQERQERIGSLRGGRPKEPS